MLSKKIVLDTAFALFLLSLLHRLVRQFISIHGCESWAISEFLNNYQGGFVRRGLTGEVLFFFAKNVNINVEWTIKIISLICFVAVVTFFVKAFLRKGYTLYILPLSFFFGSLILNGCFWTRKDPLMLLSLIIVLWIFNATNKQAVKCLAVNALSVVTLLIHEVFAFFALPVLFLLLFHHNKNKGILQSVVLSFSFLLPSISIFFLLCFVYKGNYEIAQAIWNSWGAVGVINTVEQPASAAIGALGWDSIKTFRLHLRLNFLCEHWGIISLLVWTVTFPTVYYIATNALLVFKKRDDIFTYKDRTILSSVLIFQWLCLSPVFLILSCDYGRVMLYWMASSFAIFLLISKEKIEELFPIWFTKCVERINNCLAGILWPTKTIIALLMMFIGICTVSFYVPKVIYSSVIYNILYILTKIPTVIIRNYF